MVFFLVDDKLHSHLKAMRAGTEAMGLWVLAGSWAADQLTDGWVPDYAALRISPHADEYADRLVTAGLWIPGEHDGDKGWWFHDWADNGQLSKEAVAKKRADQRERVRRWRERKTSGSATDDRGQGAGNASSNALPNASPTGNALPNALVTAPTARAASTTSTTTTTGGYVPAESTETLPRKTSRGGQRGTRLPDDFAVTPEMVAWAKDHAPHVDGRYETAQFCDYWWSKSGRDATKVDWVRTWYRWMRKEEQQAGRPTKGSTPTDADWDALK